jgi:hypothetical protein
MLSWPDKEQTEKLLSVPTAFLTDNYLQSLVVKCRDKKTKKMTFKQQKTTIEKYQFLNYSQ